ncbi:hypothetical protein OKW28_003778 [Paraburkholderia sp. 40]
MKNSKSLYHGHRFPASVISHAVRWYFRFQLSLRDVEELLFERGVIVSHESIRRWTEKFGTGFAHRVRAARRQPGSTWHLDEMFVTLRGVPYLLWRAVDQHGIELDILLQKRRGYCHVVDVRPNETAAREDDELMRRDVRASRRTSPSPKPRRLGCVPLASVAHSCDIDSE